MIKTGQAYSRRARDVAHRRRVITLAGKDARGRAHDVLEFFVVSTQIVGHNGSKNLAADERGFTRIKNVLKFSFFNVLIRVYLRSSAANYNRTYSNSNGLPLIPVAGGAIPFAIFPTSVTGFIKLRTYSRSSIVGNHSNFFASNSSVVIKFPSRSKWCPAYSPTCR